MAKFIIILLTVIGLMHGYVFWRMVSVPFIRRRVPSVVIIASGALLFIFFLASRIFGRVDTGIFTYLLGLFGMNWMAVLFLVFVCLLAIDLVTCFGLILPRVAPRLRGAAVLAGLALSLTALVQGHRPPEINHHAVHISNLPAELENKTIALLSDLHIDTPRRQAWLADIVDRVQSLHPDIIVLLGDIFESHGRPAPEMKTILNRLSAPLGVWAVFGNHEFYGGLHESETLIDFSEFTWLRNTWIEVMPGLVLSGVDDLTVNLRSGNQTALIHKALQDAPQGFTILLSHTPDEIEQAVRAGVDLMLCGHTHGGQIWPFGYLVKLRHPFFEGVYTVDGMTVVVTRGAGTWGPRMRLWRRSEILMVQLHKAS